MGRDHEAENLHGDLKAGFLFPLAREGDSGGEGPDRQDVDDPSEGASGTVSRAALHWGRNRRNPLVRQRRSTRPRCRWGAAPPDSSAGRLPLEPEWPLFPENERTRVCPFVIGPGLHGTPWGAADTAYAVIQVSSRFARRRTGRGTTCGSREPRTKVPIACSSS